MIEFFRILVILAIVLIPLWLIIVAANLGHAKFSSIGPWDPCDDDSVLDKISKFVIGHLQCECCILFRGIFIGVYLCVIPYLLMR